MEWVAAQSPGRMLSFCKGCRLVCLWRLGGTQPAHWATLQTSVTSASAEVISAACGPPAPALHFFWCLEERQCEGLLSPWLLLSCCGVKKVEFEDTETQSTQIQALFPVWSWTRYHPYISQVTFTIRSSLSLAASKYFSSAIKWQRFQNCWYQIICAISYLFSSFATVINNTWAQEHNLHF